MALTLFLGTFLLIGFPAPSTDSPAWPASSLTSKGLEEALGDQNSIDRLATLLEHWEDAEKSVKDIRKHIHMVAHDAAFRQETVTQAEVIGKKPNVLRYELKDAKNRPLTKLICTGKLVRCFDYREKMESVCDLPDNYPDAFVAEKTWAGFFAQAVQLNLQWNCLGFDVSKLKEGYKLSLAKEDSHYSYIVAVRRDLKAMSSLSKLTIAIGNKDFMTYGTLALEPNGNRKMSIFTEVRTNADPPVDLEMIQADLPLGWKTTMAPSLIHLRFIP